LTASSFVAADSLVVSGASSGSLIVTNGSWLIPPTTLKAGANINFGVGTGTLTINATDTDTWTAVNTNTSGYLYRCSSSWGTKKNEGNNSWGELQWFGEIQVRSAVRFKVAHGYCNNISRGSTGTITFMDSSFFTVAPVVLISFSYNSSTWAEYTRIASTSKTGFGWGLASPSGTSGSGCMFYWIAIQYYGSL
jgi:hypothetical protein